MRRLRRALALCLALAACDRASAPVPTPTGAGARLEQAAIGAGIIADPATLDPVGAYASDSDRICITRAEGDGYRIGASVDYGGQQGCRAQGSAMGRETLEIDFGDDCRTTATVDGERITLAPTVPPACARRCTGRATLAALTAPRLSGTVTEARAMRGSDDKPLCD